MLIDLKNISLENISHVFTGGYVCGMNSPERILLQETGKVNQGNYDYDLSYFSVGELNSYGVVDSPEQFYNKFEELLQKDSRKFVVFFNHVQKDNTNKWKGGGWRWHKWGPYYGNGKPECEYLDNEDGFDDGVYIYHIYILAE